MSEIIDFIIELIAVITGRGKNFGKEVTSAPYVDAKDRDIVIQRMNEHLMKDPSTSNLNYSHLFLVKSKRGVAVTALDDEFNKVITVHFGKLLEMRNDTGRITIHQQ